MENNVFGRVGDFLVDWNDFCNEIYFVCFRDGWESAFARWVKAVEDKESDLANHEEEAAVTQPAPLTWQTGKHYFDQFKQGGLVFSVPT